MLEIYFFIKGNMFRHLKLNINRSLHTLLAEQIPDIGNEVSV